MAAAAATLLPVVTLPVTVSPRADPAQTEKTVVLGRKPRTRIAPAAMDAGSVPKKVEMKINPNGSQENFLSWARRKVPYAFISEEELIDEWYMILNRAHLVPPNYVSTPLVL